MTDHPRHRFLHFGLVLLVAGMALLPWWRNHTHLRDLYDYGLVLAANGHMDLGERPYVDFTTPIQAGFLGLNWLIERAGGGNYFALTLGGAGLILASAGLLVTLLARRWPWWAAAAVGGAVTVAGASQHTILWHNALGLSCLALVVWSAACAPVWRRPTWLWHALLAAGLFLGGINKLNFQLVAVAGAVAWTVRAGLLRQAGWGHVGGTIAAILLAGVVLPVVAELAWTGASLSLWSANVVQLASGSRLEILKKIPTADFLLKPIHDYYGRLPVPQVGLAGCVMALATLVGCWPEKNAAAGARWDRWLVPVAVPFASAAGTALLATNFEIASVGLGAWLVLLVSLWLGFAPTGRRGLLAGGVVLPALVLGGSAWWSAWQGQRSQFGFSPAPRAEYLPAQTAGPAFARLAGLRLPPDVVASLTLVEDAMPEAGDDGRRPVFYGPGLEFLDRFFPSRRDPRQALWGHWDTTYSAATRAQLAEKIGPGGRYEAILVTAAFDQWPGVVWTELERYYYRDLVGPRVSRWSRWDKNHLNLTDTFDTLGRMGGNVASRLLVMDRYPLRSRRLADGRMALGTLRNDGCVLVGTPVNRLRGVAVLERTAAAGDRALYADFKAIIHGSSPEDRRWGARIELPAGQQSVSVPFEVGADGRALQLWVSQPAEKPAVLFAGFRELEITHGVDTAGVPALRAKPLADVAVTPEMAASLFGDITWRPQQMIVRGGAAGGGGLELSAGGEVWLHTDNMNGEIRGRISRAGSPGRATLARVVWYRGGRLQLLQQAWTEPGQSLDFHVWTAEPGGWVGILLDPGEEVAPVQVRVTSSSLAP